MAEKYLIELDFDNLWFDKRFNQYKSFSHQSLIGVIDFWGKCEHYYGEIDKMNSILNAIKEISVLMHSH